MEKELNEKKNNSIISKLITFIVLLVHFGLSIGFLFLGYMSIGFMGTSHSAQDIFTRNLAYVLGIILLIVSFITLFKRNIKMYWILFSVTLLTNFFWILIEGSSDAILFITLYLIIFIPLLLIKNKLDKKKVS